MWRIYSGYAASRVTLRRWLELEEASSPFATGQWPGDPLDILRATAEAWAILFPSERVPEAEQAAARIGAELAQAFSTALECRWPSRPGEPPSPRPPHDGAGWLARMVSRLCTGLGITPAAALDLPLDQAFLLAAGWNLNEGMESTGEDYRDREQTSPSPSAAPGGRKASAR
ncbi:MAG: hypothetical protein SNJ52_00185 [Verrucomicrobiia bacterium]